MTVSFGDKIRRIRANNGLSQQQLANILKVDRSSVASWETDRRIPAFETISRIAEYFNVNLSEFGSTNEANMENINIIMVDDERIILNGGTALLRKFFPNAAFNGFTTARSALEFAENNRRS